MTPEEDRASPSPLRVLAGGTLLLLGLRIAISLTRSGPVLMADEAGYLFHARVLAGGMPAEMGPSPFYRGGYAVLLAPAVAVLKDPAAAYHAVLVVNALLAACLVPLLFLLLRRCFAVRRRLAAWAAVAGAAYPSVTASAQVALAENLLFPLTAAWLLATGCALRRPSVPWAVAAGSAAALLWTAHGRMVVVVGLTALSLLTSVLGRRRRADLVAAAAGMTALAVGSVLGSALNHWLRVENYRHAPFSELERVLGALDDPGGVRHVLENVAGQTWYLLVATLGLALVVACHAVPAAARRLKRRCSAAGDTTLALVVLLTAGLLAESALWFAVRDRPDQLVYGRYLEPVAPALVALGVVALANAGRNWRWRAPAGALAALTVVVALVRAQDESPLAPSRWNVASLPSVTGTLDAPVLLLAGVLALGALALLVLVARRASAAVGMAVLVLFLPTTAYLVRLPVIRSQHDDYPAGWTSPRPAVDARRATRVGFDTRHYDHVAVKTYQWALPKTRFVPYDGDRDPVPAPLTFGAPADPPAPGARMVWRDPGRPLVLWELPR